MPSRRDHIQAMKRRILTDMGSSTGGSSELPTVLEPIEPVDDEPTPGSDGPPPMLDPGEYSDLPTHLPVPAPRSDPPEWVPQNDLSRDVWRLANRVRRHESDVLQILDLLDQFAADAEEEPEPEPEPEPEGWQTTTWLAIASVGGIGIGIGVCSGVAVLDLVIRALR